MRIIRPAPLGLLVGLVACAVTSAPAAAKGLPSYHSPGYKGTSRAPKTVAPPTPKPIALAAAGRFPHVIVDAAGTAHIVWTQDDPNGPSVLHYCRIKRGETACDNPPGSQTFIPDKPYGVGDDPRFNTDNNGPQVVAVGDQVVIMTHRYPTVFPKPDKSDGSNTTLIWVSEDGGTTFTGPGLVGTQDINGGRAVEFGADNDPTIGVLTDTTTGGTYFQAIRPGAFTSAKANLGDTGPDQAYSGSLALLDGRPVAAFADLKEQTFVRQWTGTQPITDPGTWTAPVLVPGDEPQLAGGSGGLFLMNRPKFGTPYVVRRLGAGLAAGPAATISTKADPGVFHAFNEDPSGRLLATWEARSQKNPGVQLRTSTDGANWSTARQIFDAAGAGQLGIDAAADGGGFAVANLTGGVNATGAIAAVGFGKQTKNGAAGLGSLSGGGDQGAVSSCSKLAFGTLQITTDNGCFLHGTGASARVSVSTDEIDLNGLRIVPDAGVSIAMDARQHTLDTTGSVRVLLTGGGVTVTLFHGELHLRLPTAGVGTTLFSFDQSAFGLDLFGFGAKGKVDVILTATGVRIPISLALPPIFGDVRGDATLVADRATGLHFDTLHIHVGNILLGPLLIDHLDVSYSGASDTWTGDGAVQFPPPGAGGGLAIMDVVFTNGAYKHGGFTYTPPPPGIVIGPFVYLNSIGGELGLDPTHIGAHATIGAGTPGVGGVSPVNVVGNFDMTFPSRGPADFRMSGAVSFFVFQVATGFLDFQTDGYASFGGELGTDLGPLHIAAKADGFVDATNGNFGADINGNICVNLVADTPLGEVDLGCVGLDAEIAVSNAGFAACAGFTIAGVHATGGIDYPFADFSPVLLANPLLMTGSIIDHLAFPCHAGKYHVPPRPPVSRATAIVAQAGGTSVSLPGGNPSETLVLKGNRAAPDVTVTGPGGAQVGGAGAQAGYAVTPKGGTTTFVVLPKPAAGTWSVTPAAGSAPIASVLVGDGYVPATVKATLGGSGRARTLRYAIKDATDGQSIQFAETGAFGTHVLGVAKGTSGTLRFAPADAKGGRRTILALIRHDGVVTDTHTIGTYIAPGPARPGRPATVNASIGGRALTVTWGPAPHASGYAVRVRGSHGRSELHILGPRARRLRVAGLQSGETATASVAGVTATGVSGPAARTTARGHAR